MATKRLFLLSFTLPAFFASLTFAADTEPAKTPAAAPIEYGPGPRSVHRPFHGCPGPPVYHFLALA